MADAQGIDIWAHRQAVDFCIKNFCIKNFCEVQRSDRKACAVGNYAGSETAAKKYKITTVTCKWVGQGDLQEVVQVSEDNLWQPT